MFFFESSKRRLTTELIGSKLEKNRAGLYNNWNALRDRIWVELKSRWFDDQRKLYWKMKVIIP